MADVERIKIHKNLLEVLETLRKRVALDMKKKYHLEELEVPRTLSSQILAAQHRGQKVINFKVRKISLTRGALELL